MTLRALLPPFHVVGSSWRERILAAIGACLGTGLAGFVTHWALGSATAALLLAAPIGASAVLIFAVPASPLGRPWATIAGSMVSTASGIAAAHLLGHGALAAGAAVGLAMVAMSALRCLHPAGGGCALLGVLGGPAVLDQGYGFVFVPVAANAVVLVLVATVYLRLTGHRYPHRAAPAAPASPLTDADLDAAIAETGEAFDISREDLLALLARAEHHAALRRRA